MEGRFEGGGGGREEEFLVSAEPASAAVSPELESLNVCRAAALSALLGGDPGATEGVASELEEMGFPPVLATGRRTLGYAPLLDVLDASGLHQTEEGRVSLWAALQEDPNPYSGIGFLINVLGSPLERESAAAAAALWRLLQDERPRLRGDHVSYLAMEREEGDLRPLEWDARSWRNGYERSMSRLPSLRQPVLSLRSLVQRRLRLALRSPDPLAVSLAAASGLPAAPLPLEAPADTGNAEAASGFAPTTPTVSTMIHGTWGWKGDWWRPSGGFHRFIRGGVRPDLYAQGARFSWSGFYRKSHRVRACSDFRDWAEAIAPHGLRSVFGHSYGGEVAARAVIQGVPIKELVLLSAPATDEVVAAVEQGVRVVDVRLRFDPVLALARTGQRLPTQANVTAIRVKRWTLDHSASHDERIWADEDVAARAGM